MTERQWARDELIRFVEQSSGESFAREIEGPALLGLFTVWRIWTEDDEEYHAHYVIAEAGRDTLEFRQDFQPFANWLTRAFNAKNAHERRLDWYRSVIAGVITISLLGLVLWAATSGRASVDYRWLVGALAGTSIAYLMGDWVRKPGGRVLNG